MEINAVNDKDEDNDNEERVSWLSLNKVIHHIYQLQRKPIKIPQVRGVIIMMGIDSDMTT